MANVKYRVREFRPSTNQPGTHSFFAEAVIDNTIDNQNLADKIAARTGFKAYEAKAIIEAIADIVAEKPWRTTASFWPTTEALNCSPSTPRWQAA